MNGGRGHRARFWVVFRPLFIYRDTMKKFLIWLIFSSLGGLVADEFSWEVTVETGPVWFFRNDAAVPGDRGTLFDLLDLTGDGPDMAGRLMVEKRLRDRHRIRLTLAPVATEGTSTLDKPVLFRSTAFTPDSPTKAVYEFNTYRLGYSYRWRNDATWTLSAGATLLVRDAKIELSQNDNTETEEDIGVVPLLNFYARRRLCEAWSLIFDLVGSAAPQGRAFDAALLARWQGKGSWHASLGVRTIEGGADNETVYTFAWLTSAVAQVGYSF